MARAFKLPDLGEGIHEGEVIAVLVSVGDEVKEGDPILEVETDKASVEIPSPYTGKVEEILVKAGDIVKVGDVLIKFSNGEAVEKEPEKQPVKPIETAPPMAASTAQKGPVPASPATRRLARELGIDLHHVAPTGPGGLVTAEDVRAFAEKGQNVEEVADGEAMPIVEAALLSVPVPALPDFSKWGPVERIPLRSIRSLAWSQIPHVSSQDDVDITKLEVLRRRHKIDIEAQGGKLSLTAFAVKAVAAALKKYPNFNVSVDTANGEIIRKDRRGY
jgi:pyruvate dehydrogenase E2 component (dihydrolipoamide acetyltransferase)